MGNNQKTSSSEGRLVQAAMDLVLVLDKTTDAVLPREIASIVKLHAKLAVGAAFIPIPGMDVAGTAAAIWSMYGRINYKLAIPLSKNIIKSLASGILTNLGAYAATMGVASSLKFIPGLGTAAGTVIMLGTSYAVTLASGFVYLKALTILAQKNNGSFAIDESAKKEASVGFINNNKDLIKDFISNAKKDYKANKNNMDVSEEEKRNFEENLR